VAAAIAADAGACAAQVLVHKLRWLLQLRWNLKEQGIHRCTIAAAAALLLHVMAHVELVVLLLLHTSYSNTSQMHARALKAMFLQF
jgi:hypothetical protein